MMRRIRGLRHFGVQIATLLALGCTPIPPHPQVDSLEQGFSGRLAAAHLESIEGFYPRFPGSSNDKIVRAYLAREFRRVGARTRILVEGDRRHLIAERKGVSDDVVLLVAPYSALESEVLIDDSGAALLLEFARVLGSDRPPYTLGFVLAETRPEQVPSTGEAEAGEEEPRWEPILTSVAGRQHLTEAGRSLARGIEAEGATRRVRAVIVFDTSRQAGQGFARDLRSHPEFRRLFWESAAGLGFASMFPADGGWTSPDSLHLGFREQSMDRALALVHVETAWDDPAAMPIPAESSPEMFDSIGVVTVDALSRLMRRFQKVDAFSR